MTSTEDIRIFGDHEQKVVDQLTRCVQQEEGSIGVLCADGHFGYSAPIGANIAYREHVSPAAVGFDIGCGNLAVATNLHNDLEFKKALPGLMNRIFAEVSFGVGRPNDTPVDHPVLEAIRTAEFVPQRQLYDLAAKQLGTVGAGNHYVDVFADEQDRVWIGVHFGSRGFGHKTASGFLAIAQHEVKHRGATGRSTISELFSQRGSEGEMESAPDLLRIDSVAGEAYLYAMDLAGSYAYAGRDVVVDQILGILGAQELEVERVHNHHNFSWREEHAGEQFWVVRKGATPAFPGQRGFVGATMGEDSVILEGVDSDRSAAALYSTVHGAGRAMSRTQAAGKRRKRWACLNRDCDWVQSPGQPSPMKQVSRSEFSKARGSLQGNCPRCGHNKLNKRWIQETDGAIDWDATRADLVARGIELRGAAADEAPGAYKRLSEVLTHHERTVKILHTLTPLGVAMAGPDVEDPFKD